MGSWSEMHYMHYMHKMKIFQGGRYLEAKKTYRLKKRHCDVTGLNWKEKKGKCILRSLLKLTTWLFFSFSFAIFYFGALMENFASISS